MFIMNWCLDRDGSRICIGLNDTFVYYFVIFSVLLRQCVNIDSFCFDYNNSLHKLLEDTGSLGVLHLFYKTQSIIVSFMNGDFGSFCIEQNCNVIVQHREQEWQIIKTLYPARSKVQQGYYANRTIQYYILYEQNFRLRHRVLTPIYLYKDSHKITLNVNELAEFK